MRSTIPITKPIASGSLPQLPVDAVHFETARALWRLSLRFDLKPAEEKVFAVVLFEGVARGLEGLLVSGSHRDLGEWCKFGRGHEAERARVAVKALVMHGLLLPGVRVEERGSVWLRVNFNVARWCASQHCDVAMHLKGLNVLLAANGSPAWLLPPEEDLNSVLPEVCRESFMERMGRSLGVSVDARGVPQFGEAGAPGVPRFAGGSAKQGNCFRETGSAPVTTRAGARAVNSLTGNRTGTVQLLNSCRNVDEENRLLEALRVEFERAHGSGLAADEMERSGGHWRKVARLYHDEMEEGIGALKNFMNEGGTFKRRRDRFEADKFFEERAWFWLGSELLRYIGVKNWAAAWAAAKKIWEPSI